EVVSADEPRAAGALLLCGWLAARLRWRIETVEPERGGLRARFRDGAGTVEALLRRGGDGVAEGRPVEVRLSAGSGERAYAFEAHRGHDTTVVHGHVQAIGQARTARTAGVPEREDTTLVADLLDERASDPVYAAALERAAELA